MVFWPSVDQELTKVWDWIVDMRICVLEFNQVDYLCKWGDLVCWYLIWLTIARIKLIAIFEVLDYGLKNDLLWLLNGIWIQIEDINILGQVMRLRLEISTKRD